MIFRSSLNEKRRALQLAVFKIFGRFRLAADFGAASELGTFLHGENLRFDVAIDFAFVFQLAAVGGDFAFDITEYFHLTGRDIAFDLGVLADGDLAFLGSDFAFDPTIDDHVVGEANGADDFDSGGEDVGGVRHDMRMKSDPNAAGNLKEFFRFWAFSVREMKEMR